MIPPSEFLNQAKQLIGSGQSTSEVDCRSAISRAYYSLFHEARNYFESFYKQKLIDQVIETLNNRGKQFELNKIASLDWNYIQRLGISTHTIVGQVLRQFDKAAAKDLNGFRDRRNTADYELKAQLKPQASKTEVEAMEQLVAFVTKL